MNLIVLNAWQMFLKGGPMMWPILILSIIAISLGIHRLISISNLERSLRIQKIALLESLRQGNLKKTMHECEVRGGLLSGVLKVGIVRFGSSIELLKGVMEEEVNTFVPRIKEHLELLSMIVNIAPLLGLLGTVNAMAVVFHAVQIRSNMLNPLTAGDLASGIWQAILTTSAGLIVAIISYIFYCLSAMRTQIILSYVDHAVIEMANILQQLSESKKIGQNQDYE